MTSVVDGLVIVVTGASSGFGKGVALRCASEGGSVVLAARGGALLDEVALECEASGGSALAVETDVSNREDVKRLAMTTIDTYGRIDIWINNAGVAAVGRFEETPLEDHIQVVATDLLGTIFGSYFALQQFREQTYGTLINVASILGKFPVPYYSSYAAAKYGVVGLGGALRQELSKDPVDTIHVCTVLPTAMDTSFFDHAANYTGHELNPVPPINDPKLVIDAIIDLFEYPQDEVIVGPGGKLANLAHSMMPSVFEKLIGNKTHQLQIEKSSPAEITQGAVARPIDSDDKLPGSDQGRSLLN